ncbi:ATP-cone domain protein [Thermovirga lienii DSM 17291]|uniref:Transcriptional repressor NrdR n=1 Tax=Thermovirga lienii (strain ATCC BAA-1197 / DSM 17291 / Cas60314) TaxID=580340 RepID=G7V6F7_THELD|nr:transcriptional regulator NrdR [Thermovirga lienii]AER67070.1 ATP-cone domain protein [Thermovirga lienii DSM 17291]
MRCPKCDAWETRVLETRTVSEGRVVRRRRECPSCQNRFTTYERFEEAHVLWVVKKGGQREAFDRDKLLKGMARACEKLSIPLDVLEEAVTRIENNLRRCGQNEIPSQMIGEMAMEELRGINKVAYVRFASVYREFTDVASFIEEIRHITDGMKRGEAD